MWEAQEARLEVKEGKGGMKKITGVVFQVTDSHTKGQFVCATHEDSPPSRVPLEDLSPETLTWWLQERERRFRNGWLEVAS